MTVDLKLLSVYMNDHIAGATAGLGRVQRMARAYEDTSLKEPLDRLERELGEEREWLMEQAKRLGFGVRTYKVMGAALGERLGRLKPNGRVAKQSPMSALLELELLRSALRGKESGWQTLKHYGGDAVPGSEVHFDVAQLDRWIAQAERQYDTVDGLLTQVRRRALLSSGEPRP